MPHPLQRKIDAVRRRARLADALRGMFIVITVLLAAVFLLASIDYLLRIEDRGVRIIFSLSALCATAWASYSFLAKRLFARRDEVEYARSVERAFPQLRNRLASSVQFLRLADDDPTGGSAALRQAVIDSVEMDSRSLNFKSIIDFRPAMFAFSLAWIMFVFAAITAMRLPELARIGVIRIANPLGETQWPEPASERLTPSVKPPKLESLTIQLIPPPYTGLKSTTSDRHIRALRGTRVFMSGKPDRPLASASVCLESGEKIPARIADDGLSFSIGGDDAPFVIERSEAYWIELIGRDGMQNVGERWQIQAVADKPPSIAVERPAADLLVTSNAIVPLRISAEDDLGIARIELTYKSINSQSEGQETIFSGPQPPAPDDNPAVTVDHRWTLAPLSLPPGTVVTFHATANDYAFQTADSETRRLTVVSTEELLTRVADRIKLIAAELGRARTMQLACRNRAESIRSAVGSAERLPRSVLDDLQAVEHAQREVRQLLADGGDSLLKQVRALGNDLENNRIDNPPLRQTLAALAGSLDRLGRGPLASIAQELAAAAKSARLELEGQGGGTGIVDSLTVAIENQNAVAVVIDAMIDRINRSDTDGGLYLQFALILKTQQQLAERTARIGRRTIARALRDLSPQDSSELAEAASDQTKLARRFERLPQNAGQAGNLSYDMSDAADHIAFNRIGRAAVVQKQIVRRLKELLGIDGENGRSDASGKNGVEIKDDRPGEPGESSFDSAEQGNEAGNATESKTPGAKPDKDQTRSRILRLWGELPPNMREKLPQTPGVDFPPEYERMIEDYFRRLAEENDRK